MTYKIVRVFRDKPGKKWVIKTGLTLEEAKEHCSSLQTSSRTATGVKTDMLTRQHGPWFDTFTEEK